MDNKHGKLLSGAIAIAILLIILVGITYAFFNYTRTGSANTIRVGRIAFVTRQTETISLTNLFPIDPTETGIMDDDEKVGTLTIEIEGDTDYSGGVEYLVSSVDSSITTSTGKIVPLSLNVTVNSDLGTSSANYFTARENTNTSIYKRLVGDTLVGDQMLLVGYIAPNSTPGTASGIDGSITIKAYLDKNKILISDTYDGSESDDMGTTNNMAYGKTVLTTDEWNSLQSSGLSFKVKVEANEGIWVTGSLEEIMRKSAVMDNINSDYVDNTTPGINFANTPSDTNGKGVYMRYGTQNDTYPIMYYRGDVTDNNVLFANKCWKAVRTTDTGGVKLVYNGELSQNKASLNESDYGTPVSNNGFTFDTTDNSWNATMTMNITSSEPYEISFNVPAGDGYILQITGVPTTVGGIGGGIYKGGSQVSGFGGGSGNSFAVTYNFGTLTSNSSDVVKVTYYMSGGNSTEENPSTIKVKMIHPDATLGMGCDNSSSASQITLNSVNIFPFSGTSMNNSMAYNGYMWGDVYQLKQKNNLSSSILYGSGYEYSNGTYTLTGSSSGFANSRHYTCFNTTGTCTNNVSYVVFSGSSGGYANYLELQNGDTIEQAIQKMQTNTNNSNAKDKIDTWYVANLNSYTNKIEDTIYCNDRTIDSYGGWNQQGNDWLYYAPYYRTVNISGVPPTLSSLNCTNKNDRFTVHDSRGNQALTYPVALLTTDEIRLAGTNGYLNSGSAYWTMSPSNINNNSPFGFCLLNYGALYSVEMYSSIGLRPVVSLKPGTPVVSGSGTATDPYVIE